MHHLQCGRQRGFAVVLRRQLLDPACPSLAEAIGGRRAFVVTTPTVDRVYGPALRRACEAWGVDHAVAVLPLDERTKTMDSVLEVCALARANGIGRRDLIVAFGGGVATDVVTMAASLYRRGVPCLRLPTTLTGQIDAGIGVKSAVNAHGAKSALGCFDPPEAVISDPGWLTSLPRRALRSGFAEIIKIAAVRDADLLDLVLRHGPALVASGFAEPAAVVEPMLGRSIDLMLDELRVNPYEDDLERVVDFGHTFSPALEIASHHQLTHGEAVAIDIALSTSVARHLGLLAGADADVVLTALRSMGLPTGSPLVTPRLLAAAADEAVAHRGGALNLVLLRGLGRPVFLRSREELSERLLRAVVRDLDRPAPVDLGTLSTAGARPSPDGAGAA